jgi:hypothetical protein
LHNNYFIKRSHFLKVEFPTFSSHHTRLRVGNHVVAQIIPKLLVEVFRTLKSCLHQLGHILEIKVSVDIADQIIK